MAANDAAMSVLRNAEAVTGSTRSSEPALKPYQPNHSRPVPSAISGTLCGLFSITWRRPTYSTEASAANPADACTTIPPAKSSTPHFARMPSGLHSMCTNGKYTKMSHAGEEQKVRLERHAIGERAGDERRRDDREHHLIRDVHDERNAGVVAGEHRMQRHAVQKGVVGRDRR